MRTDNVEVTLKFPVPIDKPDENGVMYTEEAIINACRDIFNQPII